MNDTPQKTHWSETVYLVYWLSSINTGHLHGIFSNKETAESEAGLLREGDVVVWIDEENLIHG